MSNSTYYKEGDANAICDRCGFECKLSQLKREWNGLMTCDDSVNGCWEPRHPQDFLRAVPDNQSVPNARPEQPDQFLDTNDVTVDDL